MATASSLATAQPLPSEDAEDGSGISTPPAPARSRGLRARRANEPLDWVKQRAAQALASRQAAQEQIVLQEVLPLWSDDHRGVPNPMIRSGLFGTKSNGKRVYAKNEAVTSLSNISILYTGEELTQEDLSVWMSLINMARQKRIGDVIFFTGYELVKDLGWRMHSESYQRAKDCIARLKANELKIQVKTGQSGYAGSLIREYAWAATDPDGGKDKWMVRFEPMIAELFRDDSVTYLEWEQRRQIGPRNRLALWLHAYFMSHTDPLPITVQKLHELCKSEEKHLKSYKVRLRAALEVLVTLGALVNFTIVGDTVHVKRAPLRLSTLKNAASKRLT